MTKLFVSTIGLTFILVHNIFGQSSFIEKKNKNYGLFNITQVGYNRGIGTSTFRPDVVVKNRGYVNRLRTTFGYFIKPSVSIGIGFGLDGYHDPGYNTAPIVADFRYYKYPTTSSMFIAANTGYSLALGPEFSSGLVGSINVGYRFIVGAKTHLLFSAGIDTHQIRDAKISIITPTSFERIQNSIWLKSVSFNGGFLF